jgi:hypothetical protein
MTKATPALRNFCSTYPGPCNEAPRKLRGKQGWARAQIRMTVEALQQEKAPLKELTNSQIAARSAKWMRKQGKLDTEIPLTRSFERYLPAVLAEVLAGSSIG